MDEIIAWLAQKAAEIVIDEDDAIMVAGRLAVASSLDAAAFATEAIDLARVIGESVRTAAQFQALVIFAEFDTDTGRDGTTVLSAIAMAIGIGRVAWSSRPAARKARTLLVDQAHAAYAIAGRLGPDLYAWLAGMVAVAVRLISDLAANATPMVTVESGLSLPSTVLAYQLYADSARAGALVEIAGSATPMIMPGRFEALAS
jgi:hypothetical protein